MEKIKIEINEFMNNRVWTTKKIRILAEERMNNYNFHSIILINFYTFTILCYSILGLKYPSNERIIVMSVIISVALFGVSLFISLYGFREKSLAYKMSHIELTKIETKLNILILDENINKQELLKKFNKYQDEYTEILSKTENHRYIDYLKYITARKEATDIQRIQYFLLNKCMSIVCSIFLYVIPIIGFIIILNDVWM